MKKMYQRETERHPRYTTSKWFTGNTGKGPDEADIKKESERLRSIK